MSSTLCSPMGFRLLVIGWILTTITNFPAAFTHTSVNTAVHKMNEYLNESYTERYRPLEHDEVSLIKSGINSVWYAGQVVGAVLSPFVCDRWGRKAAYIISVIMMTSACAMQMFASLTPFPEILILGRIITAIFSPLSDAALILYLQEISPARFRGTMSSLYSTGYNVMCLVGMLLGHEYIMGHSLTLLLFVPVIPGVISAIFMCIVPETPKFLMVTRNNHAAALKSLRFYQGKNADENDLMCDINGKTEGKGGITTIIHHRHLRSSFWLSVNVLVITLPFYPILQSSTFFFTQMNVEKSTAQLSSTALMVLLTVCCLISTSIVDKFPRRTMLLSGGTGCVCALSLFVVSSFVASSSLAIFSFAGFVFFYGLGVGPVAWFICPELTPIEYRSVMFCFCYAVHSCLVVITNFVTIPLFTLMGGLCFLPVFIVPCIGSLVYIYFYLPETKGRETCDIVNLLKGKLKPSAILPTTIPKL